MHRIIVLHHPYKIGRGRKKERERERERGRERKRGRERETEREGGVERERGSPIRGSLTNSAGKGCEVRLQKRGAWPSRLEAAVSLLLLP